MSDSQEGLAGTPQGADAPAVCSRAGCRAPALWRVEWRNPKIHSPDRRKVWVACDEHRDFLRDYLAARDFPVSVAPLAPEAPVAAPAPAERLS